MNIAALSELRRLNVNWYFSKLSLRGKLISFGLLTSAIAVGLTASGLFAWEMKGYRERLAAQTSLTTAIVAGNTSAAVAFSNREDAERSLAALSSDPSIVRAWIREANGRPFASWPPNQTGLLPTPPIGTSILGDRLIVVRRLLAGDDFIGTVAIEADMRSMYARLKDYALISALLALASMAAAWAASSGLQRFISTPLLTLEAIARKVSSAKDYSLRAVPAGKDEIGNLITAFNDMLDEIQRRDRKLARHGVELESEVFRRTHQLTQANEDLRKARDKAEETGRLKSEFLANMSHEIRTPMNGVLGMTELALGSETLSENREFLGIIKTSAELLMTIINDILDFSRLEAGKVEICPEPIEVRDLLASIAKPIAIRAHERSLELLVDVSPTVPRGILADPVRLTQVLVNLVGNAVKFTEAGEVRLSVSSSSEPSGSCELAFEVADTGPGIPLLRQKDVFDAFVQADGSTTRKHGGTGLGLSIAAQLVRLMGGKITVESEPEVGSKFRFALSFPVAEPPSTSPDPASLQGKKALLFDTYLPGAKIMVRTLRSWGINVTAPLDARDAVIAWRRAQAEGEPFDIVIVDAGGKSPGQQTLADVLRTESLTANVILLLRSTTMNAAVNLWRNAGLAGSLLKPATGNDLLRGCLRALGHNSKTLARIDATEGNEEQSAARILVAEDNLVNQKLVLRLLEKGGHKVTLAVNGKEAVECFWKGGWDLVLMDVQMPVMGGLEATARIRDWEHSEGLRRTPIVALTAHAMVGDKERCLQAGMDDYLSKPVRRDDLLGKVRQIMIRQKEEMPQLV